MNNPEIYSALDVEEPLYGSDVTPAILDAVAAFIVELKHTGRILWASRPAEVMFGYIPGEMAGLCVDDLVPGPQRLGHNDGRNSYMLNPTKRAMGEGRVLAGLTKDGRSFSVEVGLNPRVIRKKRVVVVIVHDMSERKGSIAKQEAT